MHKFFLMLAFTALSSSAMAEGSYTVYSCPTAQAAQSCPKLCQKNQKVTWDFKVNMQRGVVLMIVYPTNGGVPRTSSQEHCRIADVDHWICGVGMTAGPNNTFDMDQTSMNEGTFISLLTFHNPSGFAYSSSSCAKKKSLFGFID